MNKLTFIKALWSPFKPFKLKWYIGKVAIGTPYFYPRKWRKYTDAEAISAANEAIANEKLIKQSFNEWYNSYKRYEKTVPKKIGFDFVGLGWKSKWTAIDYRFEWAPVWSFVFFKWQIAITFIAPEQHHYWEAWLYYERNTDKSKSKKERIKDCIKNFPLNYTVSTTGKKEHINYYDLILKNGNKSKSRRV